MMTAAGTAVPWAPATTNSSQGVKETINSELWQACAGPLVNLPAVGTLVVYFPQGHLEQRSPQAIFDPRVKWQKCREQQ